MMTRLEGIEMPNDAARYAESRLAEGDRLFVRHHHPDIAENGLPDAMNAYSQALGRPPQRRRILSPPYWV